MSYSRLDLIDLIDLQFAAEDLIDGGIVEQFLAEFDSTEWTFFLTTVEGVLSPIEERPCEHEPTSHPR